VVGEKPTVITPQLQAKILETTIPECIALAEQREKERGYAVPLDPEFAEEVEQIVRNRKPWNPSSWD